MYHKLQRVVVAKRNASSTDSGTSAAIKAAADHAALMARAAAFQRKQPLEKEELELKAKMEQLVLETAIAESAAKREVFEEYVSVRGRQPEEESDGAVFTIRKTEQTSSPWQPTGGKQ